jgi:hypothetical protein
MNMPAGTVALAEGDAMLVADDRGEVAAVPPPEPHPATTTEIAATRVSPPE